MCVSHTRMKSVSPRGRALVLHACAPQRKTVLSLPTNENRAPDQNQHDLILDAPEHAK